MHYHNAKTILPEALLHELQRYIQGGYLYVPVEQKKHWGEQSGYRQALAARNRQIKEAWQKGASVAQLAERHHLSLSAIRKIIYSK